jgi:CPA1 family monovalent cation:H+ antiporter
MGGGVWWPLVAVILAVMGSRTVVVGITSLLCASGARPWRPGWRCVLVWAGLRGAVSLAAALSVPRALPARDLVLALTFGVVLYTLLVQGATTRAAAWRAGWRPATRCRPAWSDHRVWPHATAQGSAAGSEC